MSDGQLIERASAFAIRLHDTRGQVRRYTGEPYWHHCRAVATLVADVGAHVEMIAAAWLHDVVEDCEISPITLMNPDPHGASVTADVAAMVWDVTSSSSGEKDTLRRLEIARADSQTIKVADIIDNCSTLQARDPNRAKAYFARKRAQLAVLNRANPTLLQRARLIVG